MKCSAIACAAKMKRTTRRSPDRRSPLRNSPTCGRLKPAPPFGHYGGRYKKFRRRPSRPNGPVPASQTRAPAGRVVGAAANPRPGSGPASAIGVGRWHDPTRKHDPKPAARRSRPNRNSRRFARSALALRFVTRINRFASSKTWIDCSSDLPLPPAAPQAISDRPEFVRRRGTRSQTVPPAP